MRILSQWYNKDRKKVYQIREYTQVKEVYVFMAVGWFKSGDISPENIVEGDVWEQITDESKPCY